MTCLVEKKKMIWYSFFTSRFTYNLKLIFRKSSAIEWRPNSILHASKGSHRSGHGNEHTHNLKEGMNKIEDFVIKNLGEVNNNQSINFKKKQELQPV